MGIPHRLARFSPNILWIVATAAALRLPTLGRESLWYDETFTAWVAGRLSWDNMLRAIAGDVHPPLWYIVERVVIGVFGQSEAALRLPAALFGLATTWLGWKLAQALGFTRSTALLVGFLIAVLPVSVYYGQEARMYTMLATFVLVMVLGAIRHKWPLFVIGAIGTAYSQNLGVFYVFVVGLTLLWQARRSIKQLAPVVLSLAAIVAAWLPWGAVMLEQTRDISDGFWLQPLTLVNVLWPIPNMTMGWRMSDAFTLHLYIGALVATGIGLIVSRRWLFGRPGQIILAAAFGAPLLAAIASFAWRNIYLPRAWLPSTLLIMLFWAYPLMHLAPISRRLLRLMVGTSLAVGLVAHYFPAQPDRFDVRDWVQPVLEQWQPGDVIYHPAISTAITYGYYLPGKPYALRAYASDLNQSLTEETKEAMQFTQAGWDDLNARRVWLIFFTNPMSRRDELAFIAHVKATYPYRAYRHLQMDVAEAGIFLVEVSKSRGIASK
jgi:uncharacterized membrane protein